MFNGLKYFGDLSSTEQDELIETVSSMSMAVFNMDDIYGFGEIHSRYTKYLAELMRRCKRIHSDDLMNNFTHMEQRVIDMEEYMGSLRKLLQELFHFSLSLAVKNDEIKITWVEVNIMKKSITLGIEDNYNSFISSPYMYLDRAFNNARIEIEVFKVIKADPFIDFFKNCDFEVVYSIKSKEKKIATVQIPRGDMADVTTPKIPCDQILWKSDCCCDKKKECDTSGIFSRG